jgi:signal-transduction protein with cAMP-binding, CBS, and nucleotidyltransferase domain
MNERRKVVRIGEVMNAQVDMVDGTITVAEALKRIQQTASHALIVNKHNEDDEFGIVPLANIARRVLAHDRPPGNAADPGAWS